MVIIDKVKTSTGNEPVGVTCDGEGNVIHETYATKEELDGVGGGGTITIDPTPTSGSSNAVSSGGVYDALAAKEDNTLFFYNGVFTTTETSQTFSGFFTSYVLNNNILTPYTKYIGSLVVDSNGNLGRITGVSGTSATLYLYDRRIMHVSNTVSATDYNPVSSSAVKAAILELSTSPDLQNSIEMTVQSLFLSKVYKVGSLYISTSSTSPASFIGGTWTQLGQGRVLMGAGTLNGITYTAGTTVDAGLPNIEGAFEMRATNDGGQALINPSGVFAASDGTSQNSLTRSTTAKTSRTITFDASTSNSIYGNSTTVQPNAYVVYMWRRTA